MVAQQTLTLYVWVRALDPQPKNRQASACRIFYPLLRNDDIHASWRDRMLRTNEVSLFANFILPFIYALKHS